MHTSSQVEQSHDMLFSNNITYMTPTHVLLGIFECYEITLKAR